MHVLTRSYILIYVLAVEVDAWFVPTAAELRGITTKIKELEPYDIYGLIITLARVTRNKARVNQPTNPSITTYL